MKKVLCSYSTIEFKKSLDLLEKTANEIGQVDKTFMYDKEWLMTTEFYRKNKFILSQPKGAGYWIWKFPTIFNTMETLSEGDIVMYVDAGIKVIDNLNPLFEVAQNNPNGHPVLFKLPAVDVPYHRMRQWTKRDAFVVMDADEPRFWDADMINAAVCVWAKNSQTISFLKEWEKYLKDIRVIMDGPNICGKPNHLEFKCHRYDQSVLSILAIKHGFELFRDPTQWGNPEKDIFTNSPYPQLFHHHRNFKQ